MVSCSRRPSIGLLLAEDVDLAAAAVDDDVAGAVGAHQQRVVGLLDAGLPDHRAALHVAYSGRASCASVTSPT